MRPVTRVVGRGLPLARADVDTDQIIPASYLKRIDSTGYGDALFAAWRRDPAFVLNDERYRGATILVAGPNFGCGSSREHAAWALRDAGFAAVVSSRFADIFRANCVRNGIVPATVDPPVAERLLGALADDPALEIAIDVAAGTITAAGTLAPFDLEAHARRCLVEGLDDIGLTLAHDAAIDAYEAARAAWLPRTSAPG
jgi:3-isopropylmalate/(R)-2-methylmalate dehydratase small subunit